MAHRSEEPIRILLVGKTGSGKSATGNTIIGKQVFITNMGTASVTKSPKRHCLKKKDMNIEIMDSPGLFDTKREKQEIAMEVVMALSGLSPGPHIILYVVQPGRYTEEEYKTFNDLKKLFDEHITNFMMIALSHGEQFKKNKTSPEEYISNASDEFKKVLEECHYRYVVFENENKKSGQVEAFMKKVKEVVNVNGGSHYTCEVMKYVSDKLEERVAQITESTEREYLESTKVGQKLIKEKESADANLLQKEEEFRRKEVALKREEEEQLKRNEEIKQTIEQMRQQMKNEQESNADDLAKRIKKLELETEEVNSKTRRDFERMEKEKERLLKEKERLEREKADLKERMDKELEQVKEKLHEEELNRLKERIESEKETDLVSGIASNVWKAAKSWIGWGSNEEKS